MYLSASAQRAPTLARKPVGLIPISENLISDCLCRGNDSKTTEMMEFLITLWLSAAVLD